MLEDIAILTGGTMIAEDLGIKLVSGFRTYEFATGLPTLGDETG